MDQYTSLTDYNGITPTMHTNTNQSNNYYTLTIIRHSNSITKVSFEIDFLLLKPTLTR